MYFRFYRFGYVFLRKQIIWGGRHKYCHNIMTNITWLHQYFSRSFAYFSAQWFIAQPIYKQSLPIRFITLTYYFGSANQHHTPSTNHRLPSLPLFWYVLGFFGHCWMDFRRTKHTILLPWISSIFWYQKEYFEQPVKNVLSILPLLVCVSRKNKHMRRKARIFSKLSWFFQNIMPTYMMSWVGTTNHNLPSLI
jgi:hypothetical protein